MKHFKVTYKGTSYTCIVRDTGTGDDQVETPFLSIREATRFLTFKHGQYTRRLLLEGKLDSPHPAVRVKEKNFSKWYISIPSLVAYQVGRQVRAKGRRYILRINQSDLPQVTKALTASKVSFTLEAAYKPGTGKAKAKSPAKAAEALEEFKFK